MTILGRELILGFILVVIIHTSIEAQLYTVSRYADDNGLPSRIVHDVIQDSEGFIWVGGNNGLFKFDGKHFKPYLAALKDTVGLRDNKINRLIQTSDNRIWLGTPRGLHVLENNRITYVGLHDNPIEEQEYILDLYEDTEQNLWISTYGGLFLMDHNQNIVHFINDFEETTIPSEVIWSVTEDQAGLKWIAAKEGPFILDSSQREPYNFKPVLVREHPSIDFNDINMFRFIPYNESLLIIESNRGLLKGRIIADGQIEISKFKNEQGEYLEEYHIDDVIIDNDKKIWVGTAKNYFKKYEITEGILREIKVYTKNGLLNLTENIRSIFQDHQENIWMANSNGLYKFSLSRDVFTTFPPPYNPDCLPELRGIYAMTSDRWGYIWINTPFRLYRLKKEDILEGNCPTKYLVFEDENMQLSRNLFIDSQDRLWVGADGGLYVAQLKGDADPGRFKRYTTQEGLPHNWSYDVLEIDANTFWLGNYAGLVKMNLNEGGLENIEFKVFTSDLERPESLINSQSTDLELDAKDQLWIGTFSGLSRLLSEQENVFVNYTSSFGEFHKLSNNSIKKVFRDSAGRMWIATQRGLNLYVPEKDEFIQFGNDEGLPSEYILGIQEDSDGFLWIGTTNGILKTSYNQETKELTKRTLFTTRNGLADNIPYRNSILILNADQILIGGREGISVLSGDGNSSSNVPFNISLTAIQTTQKEQTGFTHVHDRIKDNKLVLQHFENSVKLNYAALDFTDIQFNSYRHKVLPVSEKWIETGTNSDLSYYNLSPGDYVFILDAINAQGQSTSSPIRLEISIKPPIWRSNWAILFYTLIGLLLIWLFYKFRLRKKMSDLEKQTTLERALIMEREQLRKENAADFHDELGSKVTKISLFLTLAERSLHEKGDPIPWLLKIRENVKALSGGFRDLLWVIDPQKDSLSDTFLRLKDFGEDLFDNTDINFRVTGFDEIPPNRLFNAQTKKQVVLIFKEAMNNCLKYAACNQVDLKFRSNGNYTTITIEDNGKGFDPSNTSKGRGLKNMKLRSEKIKANLKINSTKDGTSICLERIPHTSDRIK